MKQQELIDITRCAERIIVLAHEELSSEDNESLMYNIGRIMSNNDFINEKLKQLVHRMKKVSHAQE
jgi:hypothetical protein